MKSIRCYNDTQKFSNRSRRSRWTFSLGLALDTKTLPPTIPVTIDFENGPWRGGDQ